MSQALKTNLEIFVDKFAEVLNDPSVKCIAGALEGQAHEQPRRILWTRSEKNNRVDRGRRSGGKEFADTETREVQGLERIETAEFKVHTDTEPELDTLLNSIFNALNKMTGTVDFEDGGVTYAITERQGNSQRSPMSVGEVRYRTPVATETKGLTVVKTNRVICTLKTSGPLHGPEFLPPE